MQTRYTRKIKKAEYDRERDILYIHYENDRGNSYGDEIERDLIVMRDIDTDEEAGLMIFYPVKRRAQCEKNLAKHGYDTKIPELCYEAV